MQLENYDLSKLPFPDLFKTYISNFGEVGSFYEANPFSADSLSNFANSFSFCGDRAQTVQLLHEFNGQFNIEDATLKNIDRLGQENSLCIVTGQQLGLLGGPLYTMLKTVATIHLARQLEQQLERPVIPVFWLPDEDHDYDEINLVKVLTENEEPATYSLPSKDRGLPPVAEMEVPDDIKGLLSELQKSLRNTDFSSEIIDLLQKCYKPGVSFRQAFGNLIANLFSKHGLVLAGSNSEDIKKHLKHTMISAVKKADEIRDALEEQSDKLTEKFHQQATIYDSHLFYLDAENGRTKIQQNGDTWLTETGQEWNKSELIKAIEDEPEYFSPDVFLRPIMQHALLPTLGYVGGPGEISYYGQMKLFYRCFDQQMPAIFPRLSATVIDPAINRIIGELPFPFHDYSNRIEDLESEFIEGSTKIDIEPLFDEWKKKTKSTAAEYQQEIVDIDETLEGTAERAKAKYFNELDRLKEKTYSALKKKEEIQLNRIQRIKNHAFPDRILQERALSSLYFMNRYGPDIWDRLLAELGQDEIFTKHKLIYM